MKWIVLAIVGFIACYTVVTLSFRKEGPAYQPYHDAKEQATVTRLQDAGFHRVPAVVDRPAEPARTMTLSSGAAATVADAAGGLPADLQDTLIDQPRLGARFTEVRAAAKASRLLPYSIQFVCALDSHKQLFSSAYVYVRDNEIAIVPEFEAIEGALLARTQDSTVHVTIPSGTLAEGSYAVTLVGRNASKQWTLQVH